jgi:NADH:ubiquinone oxidoreductase subunit D
MSGQTRIILDVDGEKVHKIVADLGYTHRGIEKILEFLEKNMKLKLP